MTISNKPPMPAGKKINIPTFKLHVIATPVISIAGNICPATTHYKQFAQGMYPADDLQLEIVYDNVTLKSLNFLGNLAQETVLALVDDQQNTDHVVKFIVSGKTNNHSYHTETKDDVSWMLKLDLYIENLFVSGLLVENVTIEDFDSGFYMGENGTHILTWQTPIYKWLFQYEDWFVRQGLLPKS